jgi:hypothetical protein
VARVGTRGSDLIAEWSGIGRLVSTRDGASSTFTPVPDVDPQQRAKVERGVVRLLLRSLQGKIGFHGAAVSINKRAVVFLGNARDGKSTFASALCTRVDAALLADDAVALEHDPWAVLPSEEQHFLHEDAVIALGIDDARDFGGKKTAVKARSADEPCPLRAIVRLVFDDTREVAEIRKLTPVEAMAAMVPQTIRFAIDEPGRQLSEMDRLMDLARDTPTFELVRRRCFTQLERTIDLVVNGALAG